MSEEPEPVKKSRKVGALSTEETLFIHKNYATMTPAEIGAYLNRTPAVIEKYLKNNLLAGEAKEQLTVKAKLHTKSFYPQLKDTFTSQEIEYFESEWVNILMQFNENVLATEELQIKQWITLEIFIHRSMKERKKYMEDCERIEKDISREKKEIEAGIGDQNKLDALEQQLSFVRASISAYANEHTKYLEKISAITKELKGTRDQRLKRVEDGKVTWTGLIADLDDVKRRVTEGREMELMRLAMDNSRKQLMEEHIYEDKKFDLPLLNSESILNIDTLEGEDDA